MVDDPLVVALVDDALVVALLRPPNDHLGFVLAGGDGIVNSMPMPNPFESVVPAVEPLIEPAAEVVGLGTCLSTSALTVRERRRGCCAR